jgi:hypothetical protein
MEPTSKGKSPMRITDIVDAKKSGATVAVHIRFEILPVDFRHGSSPFQAYIFLAHYRGTIDTVPFEFRKCYARGCPNNLCTHVSQAVNIANRYLQRDYRVMASAGIDVRQDLFALDDMVVKFEQLKEADHPSLTIPELVGLAQAGKKISVEISLDFLPAVEHFANQENAQTFLSGEFTANTENKTYHCHRCFACYSTEKFGEERTQAIKVANARLEVMYQEFERTGIGHQKQFFSE